MSSLTPYSVLSKAVMSQIFSMLDSSYNNVVYSNNVISAKLPGIGTYIINRQPPKEEVWLSSPVSGPSHYKWQNSQWLNRNGNNLLDVISNELQIKKPSATEKNRNK
ncbi:frataxin [Nematocida sp. AWRm80]|nr:frataxin [Nematocida sp. AWRm80]